MLALYLSMDFFMMSLLMFLRKMGLGVDFQWHYKYTAGNIKKKVC